MFTPESFNPDKWDREDYERQQEAIANVLYVLLDSVHHSVRVKVVRFETPKEIYNQLKKLYERDRPLSLITAYHRMESIVWKLDTTLATLENLLFQAQNDNRAAGGDYDNAQMVAKLIRTIPN